MSEVCKSRSFKVLKVIRQIICRFDQSDTLWNDKFKFVINLTLCEMTIQIWFQQELHTV